MVNLSSAAYNLFEDAEVLDVRGFHALDSRGTVVTRLKFVQDSLQSPFILLKFTDTYLINSLEFNTDTSDGIRYIIEISKDEKSWLRVIDHSSCTCYSKQDLCFSQHASR